MKMVKSKSWYEINLEPMDYTEIPRFKDGIGKKRLRVFERITSG